MSSLRRILRPSETSRLTGYSISHIWRLERDGKFPKRIQLGEHAVGHFEDEIQAWIQARIRGVGARVPPVSPGRPRADKPVPARMVRRAPLQPLSAD